MSDALVHYEIFIRKTVRSDWTLDMACEDRDHAIEAATELLADRRAIGVKVHREYRRADGDYLSAVIFSRGDLDPPRRGRGGEEAPVALCTGPPDLYTVHARIRIARLFEGWLNRQAVTAFELLHRPDLVEALDASGMEIQHAIQKVAVPEAQATGVSTHEVIRRFQRLSDAAVARLLADARRKLFPDIGRQGLHAALDLAVAAEEPAYVLGVAVARDLARGQGWTGKVERILDLADACGEHPAKPLLFGLLQQPLVEILGGRAMLAEVLNGRADLGRNLSLLIRLAAPDEVDALRQREPTLAIFQGEIGPGLERLARWLRDPGFAPVAAALARRVMAELNGPRRLHPDDPAAEILTLRALARVLTLTPRLVALEQVEAAFIARSRRLVSAEFIEVFLAGEGGEGSAGAFALARLAKNVVGLANKRAMGDWMRSHCGGHRFERELKDGGDTPAAKLVMLAELRRQVGHMGLETLQSDALFERLGQLADEVEARGRLIQAIVRAPTGGVGRLLALLRLASGEGAPVGPVSRRARAAAMKLANDPAVRLELASQPDAPGMERLRDLMQGAAAQAA